jgi:multicomponent Na+:H+ antiporter subunit G
MREVIAAVLLLVGGAFMLLAAIGVARMPDVYTRLSAAAKGNTLGLGCLLAAAAVYFGELGVTTHAVAIVLFVILTTPVSAHLIGRAAYFVRVPLWDGTVRDDLRGRYDPHTHSLDSVPSPPGRGPGGDTSASGGRAGDWRPG